MARGQQLLDDTGNAFGQANPQPVRLAAATSGGAKPYHYLSVASNNNNILKASPGQIYSISANNTSAAWRYVKFVNKATTPSVGTDPVVYVVKIPPGGLAFESHPDGMEFTAGIGFWIVAGASNGDGTAIGAQEVILNVTYK